MRRAFAIATALNLVLAVYMFYRVVEQDKNHFHTLHQYDYIIEVDGTDSTEIYHLFDNRHYSMGSFSSAHTDSLTTLIYLDNL